MQELVSVVQPVFSFINAQIYTQEGNGGSLEDEVTATDAWSFTGQNMMD